jgi:hypothetical protein
MMGYMDKLLQEIGLTSHRKGWWKDWVYPFTVADLKGTRDEYLKKYGKGHHTDNTEAGPLELSQSGK